MPPFLQIAFPKAISIEREREREYVHMSREERQRKREREAGSKLSREPNAGLDPMTL